MRGVVLSAAFATTLFTAAVTAALSSGRIASSRTQTSGICTNAPVLILTVKTVGSAVGVSEGNPLRVKDGCADHTRLGCVVGNWDGKFGWPLGCAETENDMEILRRESQRRHEQRSASLLVLVKTMPASTVLRSTHLRRSAPSSRTLSRSTLSPGRTSPCSTSVGRAWGTLQSPPPPAAVAP